jgi:hypothetical protein
MSGGGEREQRAGAASGVCERGGEREQRVGAASGAESGGGERERRAGDASRGDRRHRTEPRGKEGKSIFYVKYFR